MTDCAGNSRAMLTCRDCIEFLMDYIDGALPASEKATFDLHLAACPPCRDYLKSYLASVRLCEQQRSECRASPMPEEMVRAILGARRAGDDGPDVDRGRD